MRRQREPAPGARPALDRDAVLAQALVLLDEVGHEKLTMRALAERLGTYPNVVYWHLGNRERVLALAVDRALAEMTLGDPAPAPWRDWLAATARELRRVVHHHPAIAPLLASRLLVSPPTLRSVEAVLTCLVKAGFAGPHLAAAYNAYVGSVVGWVCVEVAAAARPGAWQDDFRAAVAGLDADEYPTIAANRDIVADRAIALRWHSGRDRPLDDAFDLALEVWLDGLTQSRRRRGQPSDAAG